jgi:hypothetical protein
MKPNLEAIRERCEKATPGQWKVDVGACLTDPGEEPHDWYFPRGPFQKNRKDWQEARDYAVIDSTFIAHARTDIPNLLSYIEKLEKVLEAAERITINGIYAPFLDELKQAISGVKSGGGDAAV